MIEDKTGVFLPTQEERAYTFHPIKLDREAGDRAVIASGLKPGAAVVSSGAFLLKSELILQNETDED
jgi:cobalt-zinc-cadmium efflux system membrane fusion protein